MWYNGGVVGSEAGGHPTGVAPDKGGISKGMRRGARLHPAREGIEGA